MANNFQSQSALDQISALTDAVNEISQTINVTQTASTVNVNNLTIEVCPTALIQGDFTINTKQTIKSLSQLNAQVTSYTIAQSQNDIQNKIVQAISQLATSKQGFFAIANNESNQQQQSLLNLTNEVMNEAFNKVQSTCQNYIENYNKAKIIVCGTYKRNVSIDTEQQATSNLITSCIMDSIFQAAQTNTVVNNILQKSDQVAKSTQLGLESLLWGVIALVAVIGILVIVSAIVKRKMDKNVDEKYKQAGTQMPQIQPLQLQPQVQTQTQP